MSVKSRITANQKNHFLKRIREISNLKKHELNHSVKKLSDEEKAEMIRAGRAKRKLPEKLTSYTPLFQCYVFPGDSQERKIEELYAEIELTAQGLTDQVILSDSGPQAALDAIKAFEAKNFTI